MTTDNIFAYLAGFIDADGSITIIKTKSKRKNSKGDIKNYIQYRVKLSAHNCKIEPIQLLQSTFGGGKLRNTRRGKVKLHPNWRACYEWVICNNMAIIAIQKMLPFLKVKKAQALLCIEISCLKKKYDGAQRRWNKEIQDFCNSEFERIKLEINLLNKRGQ